MHVHLLDLEFATRDAFMDPLVRRIKATGVPYHADPARALLRLTYGLRIFPPIGERDLDLHVLARIEAFDRLRRVHLCRRAENGGLDAR